MLRLGLVMALGGLMLAVEAKAQAPASAGAASGTISGTIQGTPAPTLGSAGVGQGSATGVPGVGVPGLGTGGYRLISPVVNPTLSPGVIELLDLEGRFADAVAAGGGKAFGEWFAEDAVVLNNGKAAVLGRGAIAAQAQWDSKQYKLTWTAEGAQMGPSNDMGFTWGHYEGRAVDAKGQGIVTSGRYMTVWRKTKAEGWKVAMDASATEPAGAGECCALPKP